MHAASMLLDLERSLRSSRDLGLPRDSQVSMLLWPCQWHDCELGTWIGVRHPYPAEHCYGCVTPTLALAGLSGDSRITPPPLDAR